MADRHDCVFYFIHKPTFQSGLAGWRAKGAKC